jgi:hypothetical protein
MIVDARRALSESGKTQKDHNKHFDHDKIYPRSLILDAFSASETFSREPIRKRFDRFIVDL